MSSEAACRTPGGPVARGSETGSDGLLGPAEGWFACCSHCLCGTPAGMWSDRTGHDDTCASGCNDEETDD